MSDKCEASPPYSKLCKLQRIVSHCVVHVSVVYNFMWFVGHFNCRFPQSLKCIRFGDHTWPQSPKSITFRDAMLFCSHFWKIGAKILVRIPSTSNSNSSKRFFFDISACISVLGYVAYEPKCTAFAVTAAVMDLNASISNSNSIHLVVTIFSPRCNSQTPPYRDLSEIVRQYQYQHC